MAYSHRDVIVAQADALETERAQALAHYEHARVSEDGDKTLAWADRITEIDAKRAALDRIAHMASVQAQNAPEQNRFGLSPDEVEIARISNISDEQYARNKHKMNVMKDQGYWSQGRVFK